MEAGRKALEHRAQDIFGPNKTKDGAPVVRSMAPMAKLPLSQARWKS